MERTFIFFVLMLFSTSTIYAQRINYSFNNVSMTEALKTIADMSDKYTINFAYDELEDFRVTAQIKGKDIHEALQEIIGFYPIRISTDKKNDIITIECIQKTSSRVKGRIIDQNAQPLGYANITLLNPNDSTFITGGVSNMNGDFVIPCDNLPVLAKVSFIGYKTVYKLCSGWNAGTIKTDEESVKLEQVKVEGDLPIVKTGNGKLEYNIPMLMQIFPSDNAYDALSHIPGVYENEGTINFAGHGATLIINGKPTTLSAEEIVDRLKSMSADQVAKAEIMMSAPSRYHVRGLAINIITKDYIGTKRLSGQLQTTYKQSKYALGYVSGSVIYQNDNFGIDATYGFTGGANYAQAEHEAQHPLGDKRVYYADKTDRKSSGVNHDYRISTEYAFAENNRLEVSYTGNWSLDNGTNKSIGVENSTQKSVLHDYMHNVDASYSAPFGMQLSASYTNFQNPRTQNLDGKMYEEIRNYSVESRQRIGKWLFTADQVHNLKNNLELSYGAKYQTTSNESYQTTIDKSTGETIPAATSYVNYDEQIFNCYAGFNKQFSQAINIDASITAEHYKAQKWDEWRLYPTFNLMWNVNSAHMLNLSFSSDAVYPSYWSTMSDIYYSSAYDEIWGNPELKPSSVYDIDLTWQLKQRYTFDAFVSIRPNYAVQLPYQPTDRMSVIMKETNFDYSNQSGIVASARFNIGQWLNGMINTTMVYRHDKSEKFFDLPFDRHCVSAIISGNISAKLLKKHDLRLNLTPFFQSKAIQGVYDIDPLFTMNAQVRWASIDGKWSLYINGGNIFNNHMEVESIQGNQDYKMRMWKNYRNVSLTAIYRIEGFKEKKHKKVDTSRMGY